MLSTTTSVHLQRAKHQTSPKSLKSTNKSKKSTTQVVLHQPMPSSPPPPEDWILFPDEVIAEKHSSIRPARAAKPAKLADPRRQTLPSPENHVTSCKAATPMRHLSATHPAPYRPSRCLHHMSARNCTAACFDAGQRAETQVPPKAPSPPRLPTPDISEIGEDDLWSCCRSSESKGSDSSIQSVDDLWDKMGTTSF